MTRETGETKSKCFARIYETQTDDLQHIQLQQFGHRRDETNVILMFVNIVAEDFTWCVRWFCNNTQALWSEPRWRTFIPPLIDGLVPCFYEDKVKYRTRMSYLELKRLLWLSALGSVHGRWFWIQFCLRYRLQSRGASPQQTINPLCIVRSSDITTPLSPSLPPGCHGDDVGAALFLGYSVFSPLWSNLCLSLPPPPPQALLWDEGEVLSAAGGTWRTLSCNLAPHRSSLKVTVSASSSIKALKKKIKPPSPQTFTVSGPAVLILSLSA